MSLISSIAPSNRRGLLRGFTVLFVTTALLLPSLVIAPFRTAQANVAPAAISPPPVSSPPEPYLVSGSGFQISSLPTILSVGVISWGERIRVAATSILAFVAPSMKKNSATVVEPLSPPSPPALPPLAVAATYDFDGDGKADIGRWHPTNAEFKIKNSGGSSPTNHCTSGTYNTCLITPSSSLPVPGNYDGDNITDVATVEHPERMPEGGT